MDTFTMTSKLWQIREACVLLYWDRREWLKKQYQEALKEHQERYKTDSLLSSAIAMSEWKEAKEVLVILGSAI